MSKNVVVPDDIKYYYIAKEKQAPWLFNWCNVNERRKYTKDYVNWYRQFVAGSPIPTKDLVQRLDKGFTCYCGGNENLDFNPFLDLDSRSKECQIFVKKLHVLNEGSNDDEQIMNSKGKIIVVPKTEVMRNIENKISNCGCACKNNTQVQGYLNSFSTTEVNFDEDYIDAEKKKYGYQDYFKSYLLSDIEEEKTKKMQHNQRVKRNNFKTKKRNPVEQQKKESTVKAMLLDLVVIVYGYKTSKLINDIVKLYTESHDLFINGGFNRNRKGKKKQKLGKKALLEDMKNDLDHIILSLQFKINLIQALLYPAEVTISEDYEDVDFFNPILFDQGEINLEDEDMIDMFLNEPNLDGTEDKEEKDDTMTEKEKKGDDSGIDDNERITDDDDSDMDDDVRIVGKKLLIF